MDRAAIRQLATGQSFTAYEIEIWPGGGAVLRVDGVASGGQRPDEYPGEFGSAEAAREFAATKERIGRYGGRLLTWTTHP